MTTAADLPPFMLKMDRERQAAENAGVVVMLHRPEKLVTEEEAY